MALLDHTEKYSAIFTTIFTHWPGLIFDSGLLPVNLHFIPHSRHSVEDFFFAILLEDQRNITYGIFMVFKAHVLVLLE